MDWCSGQGSGETGNKIKKKIKQITSQLEIGWHGKSRQRGGREGVEIMNGMSSQETRCPPDI